MQQPDTMQTQIVTQMHIKVLFTLTCIHFLDDTNQFEYLKEKFNILLMTKSVSGLQNTTIH